jgi:hypothetical protein
MMGTAAPQANADELAFDEIGWQQIREASRERSGDQFSRL